jgi:hypothetical protein
MPEIVLTPEQWTPVAGAARVEVKDPSGRVVGWLDAAEAAVIAECERRSAERGPCFTSEQIRRHMAALEAERQRLGGMDKEALLAFAEKLRADDPPLTPWPGAGGR